MATPEYNFTDIGNVSTSTGAILIKTGPTLLHAVNINSSGTGTFILYNDTASSTGTIIGAYTVGVPRSHIYDIVCPNGLMRGNTTSTADVTVVWG
jgi:hypothetical protein